jgi:hypothetical protein
MRDVWKARAIGPLQLQDIRKDASVWGAQIVGGGKLNDAKSPVFMRVRSDYRRSRGVAGHDVPERLI